MAGMKGAVKIGGPKVSRAGKARVTSPAIGKVKLGAGLPKFGRIKGGLGKNSFGAKGVKTPKGGLNVGVSTGGNSFSG